MEKSVGWGVFTSTGGCLVVFAPSKELAIKKSLEEFQMDESVLAECDRLPNVDKYAPGPVPVKFLIEELGMVPECPYCGQGVDELYYDYIRDRPMEPVFQDELQEVFCSEDCKTKFDAEYRKSLH